MNNTKRYIKWLVICLAVFIVSVFAHECGHGLANAIAGIPCSTGFNRVGDIYKYPSDAGFREFYSTADSVLLDFGVPCTILLAMVGTILFAKSNNSKLQHLGAALAIGNGLLRAIPCSMVLFTPLVTGNIHVEDEYQTGELLVKSTGSNIWLYVPAFVSWAITVVCLVLTVRISEKKKIEHRKIFTLISILAVIVGFVVTSVLDNYIRINWMPF
jgi:hypothetical protein